MRFVEIGYGVVVNCYLFFLVLDCLDVVLDKVRGGFEIMVGGSEKLLTDLGFFCFDVGLVYGFLFTTF